MHVHVYNDASTHFECVAFDLSAGLIKSEELVNELSSLSSGGLSYDL